MSSTVTMIQTTTGPDLKDEKVSPLTVDPSPVDLSTVSTPNDIAAVPGLLRDINRGVDFLWNGGADARHKLILKARALVQALETPRETMLKHCWAQTGAIAGLTTGMEMGLWALMAKQGDRPQKVADLAAQLDVDPLLLGRLMRHLGAMGYITETAQDEYKPTNFTKALSLPVMAGGYISLVGGTSQGPHRFFEFARENGFRNPTDKDVTSMQRAYATDKNMFSWLDSIGYGDHFNKHMGGYALGRSRWMEPHVYPVRERLLDGADINSETALLVDIGGGLGHDLEGFRAQFPDHPGKLILEDLPAVVADAKLHPTMSAVGYDFYDEQPVVGARAYYMHSVLHDWPDATCRKILARVTAAMKPGYSKLLINENVFPRKKAPREMTALDMVMLTLFSSQERTLDHWHELLEGAGLRIVSIWSGGKTVESLIECELAPETNEKPATETNGKSDPVTTEKLVIPETNGHLATETNEKATLEEPSAEAISPVDSESTMVDILKEQHFESQSQTPVEETISQTNGIESLPKPLASRPQKSEVPAEEIKVGLAPNTEPGHVNGSSVSN